MRDSVLRALLGDGQGLCGKVKLAPPGLRDLVTPGTREQEQFGDVAKRPANDVESTPREPGLVIRQNTVARSLTARRFYLLDWGNGDDSALDRPITHAPQYRERPVGRVRASAVDNPVQQVVNVSPSDFAESF